MIMPTIAVGVDIHEMSIDDTGIRKSVKELFQTVFSSPNVIICDEDKYDECDFSVSFRAFNFDSGFGDDLYNVSLNIENNETEKEFKFQTSDRGRLTKEVLDIASPELFSLAVGSLPFLVT